MARVRCRGVLAVPAAASADTFCVSHTGCTGAGHNFTTIDGALGAAASNGAGTLDTIEVGPGTYDEDVTDAAGNKVNIVGSGDSTDIAPSSSASNQQVLSVAEGGTSVSALKITIPAGSGNAGISVAQTIGAHGPSFSHVDVLENATATDAFGAELYGSSFSDGSVLLTDANSHGVFLTDSSLSGSTCGRRPGRRPGYVGHAAIVDRALARHRRPRRRLRRRSHQEPHR